MTLASSLHKNKMTRAMSSAFGHLVKSAFGMALRFGSVSMMLGRMLFTRTPVPVNFVALEAGSISRSRVFEPFPFGLIAIGNNNVGAFFEKCRSHRAPQAASAPGDQNGAALESRAHRDTSRLT